MAARDDRDDQEAKLAAALADRDARLRATPEEIHEAYEKPLSLEECDRRLAATLADEEERA